jgi:hypothetical protein
MVVPPVVICCLLSISSLIAFQIYAPAKAMTPGRISSTYPILKDSLASKVGIGTVGMQVSMTTNLVNTYEHDVEFTLVIEARDSNGITGH